jgi:soluble lytic murein transglycosylase-like protein
MVKAMRLPAAAVCAVLVLAACNGDRPDQPSAAPESVSSGPAQAAPPAPDAAIPRRPGELAERLAATQRALDDAIDRWRKEGDTAEGTPPEEVTLYALDQQRIHRLLSRRAGLARAVLRDAPGAVAAHARATIRASRKLTPLAGPPRRLELRTGPAEPAGVLLRHYRRAQRRLGVPWPVLAAVNFVESAFGKVRSSSTAGAQGPMQFIPSTWAAYGMGGDVHDPGDAIMGAANYLRASGAPGDLRGALYAYNPSPLYVDAVLAYTNRIRRDTGSYFAYYSWQVFVRDRDGARRITGPGVES